MRIVWSAYVKVQYKVFMYRYKGFKWTGKNKIKNVIIFYFHGQEILIFSLINLSRGG